MNNRVVVITGGTRGYGYAIAEAVLRAGATVVICGRSRASLRRAVKTLKPLGEAEGFVCDVRREHQVYALARRVVDRYKRIDVWINNAGYSASAGMILDTPPKQAVDIFSTNAMGTFHGSRAALHFMLKQGEGTLVNIYGHGSFLRPASPTGLYGASKAWVTSFTRTLAREIAGSNVRLIGFSPGMLTTEMLTTPTVIGQRGRAVMKQYPFVLRLLARPPEKAAEKLAAVIESSRKPLLEYRMFRPWTPLAGMVRMAWERITGKGRAPQFRIHFTPAYRPRI
jgi:NAD(P)-dependent dehydrogenase (short-subunit alcohol dehydrogenase family)